MGPAGGNGLGSTFAMWASAGLCLPCAVARTHALQQMPRRKPNRPRFRGTDVTEYFAGSRGSFRLDVGGPDHLAPLLGIVGDELAEVGR